jgi:hypothetical protein
MTTAVWAPCSARAAPARSLRHAGCPSPARGSCELTTARSLSGGFAAAAVGRCSGRSRPLNVGTAFRR